MTDKESMKIILTSVGTRGDMEPLLAIGELLKEKGHQAICAFPEQFKDLAEESNLQFASLGRAYIDLLESDYGKAAMGGGGSGFRKFMAYMKLARNQTKANKELINQQYEIVEREAPERIVYNGKAVYPVLWSIRNPGKASMVSPLPYMHYVKDHTHIVFNNNLGSFLNKLTYALADFGLVTTVLIAKKWLGLGGRRKPYRKKIRSVLRSNKTLYTISPSLFPRPGYWSENLLVLGFQQKSKSTSWQPDSAILDFLENHRRILFISFGSMTNTKPERISRMFINILERNKIPAIINEASGGLVKPDSFTSEWVHFVDRIPYGWIFPRVYGVIHHGGSGTTHMSLKHGCVTMIIPHIIDQFVWNRIVGKTGAGPKGISFRNVTEKRLEVKILELMHNESFKKKAGQLAAQMEKEDFSEELYTAIIGA